jgi:hypothetical protein
LAVSAWQWYAQPAMLRRLLVTLFAVGVGIPLTFALLWVIDVKLVAAQVERKNCPAGFHWERMSGQCCVQDYETIPDHGRIGYTGNSICDDGYAATYEQRPTTDGQGPPGCPGYTSFAFLTSCIKSGSAVSGGDGGISIRDLSDAVFHGGSGPSARELAAVGGLSTGVLVLSTGTIVVLRRRPLPLEKLLEGLRARPEPGEVSRAWREWRAALEQFEKIRESVEYYRRRRERLVREFAEMVKLIQNPPSTLGLTGVQVLGGLIALAAGFVTEGAAWWIPWALRGTGLAVGVGAAHGKSMVAEARGGIRGRLAEIDSDIYAVDRELDRLNRIYNIAEKRVTDTRGRYESLRGME